MPAQRPKKRCGWCEAHPEYIAYHDDEWGVPEHDDRALFEKLVLDGFQAGLSWWIILKKRESFRRAFDGFDPEVIARYRARKIASLMKDEGIVRNRAKIEASVSSAKAYLHLREERGSFATYVWDFVDGKPVQNNWEKISQIPAQTPVSVALAKDLKARGFRFCGPTIIYAFMQAVGMTNDHLVGCFRHAQVRRLR